MKKIPFFILALVVVYLTGCHYDPASNPGNIIVVRPAANDTIIGGTKNYQVTWSGTGINSVKTFEYSLDSGVTWTTIGTQVSDTYLYNWNVPDTVGDHSFLRIVDKNGLTGKSGAFTIKSSVPPGPGKTIAPKAGSTYTFKNTTIDTNGVTIESSAYFTTDSVVETGISYMGKSNVTHVVTTNLSSGVQSDSYLNFEPNGDVSFYSGGGAGFGFGGGSIPDWTLFGAQSHTVTHFNIADTSVDLLGNGTLIHIVIADSIFYVDNGTFSIMGKNLAVINMNQVVNFTGSIVIPLFSSRQISHFAMAPSIGYYADQRTDPGKSPIPGGQMSQGSESILTSYTLR
jgi:hypothetical protein